MICKLCSSPNHTIDLCPNKTDNITYCQYCQSSNCYASRCEKMKMAKTCSMCGDQDHGDEKNCPINQVAIRNNQQSIQRRTLGPCYNCQGPHIVANCPQRAGSSQNQQIQTYRDQNRQNYNYRGNFGRGYQNNGPRTFYRGGSNQNNMQTQNYNSSQNNTNFNPNYRGGFGFRGNGNYRGNYNPNFRGNYNPNYRGGYNSGYQNYRGQRPQNDPNLHQMRNLFENWMLQNQPGNLQMGQQQNAQNPTITFPQVEPKNQ